VLDRAKAFLLKLFSPNPLLFLWVFLKADTMIGGL
jgi:hypothetical protein